jgi:uncharacterized protein YndB with AHSA1/START domain
LSLPHRTVHAQGGEQSLTFSRNFQAPAQLVFRAHVEPDLFVRWLGPRGSEVRLERFEARTGGAFRYTVVGDQEYVFFGAYHEVVAPRRLVHTWEFAGDPGRPTLESLTFTDLADGSCRLDGLSVYTSAAHCHEMLTFDQSGGGMDENFERLDELLAQRS